MSLSAFATRKLGELPAVTSVAASLPFIDIHDSAYGAVGDGVTDDAPAWLSAFNAVVAAGGGTVLAKAGKTYLLSYGLVIPSNCTINLNGATLRATTTFGQGVGETGGKTATAVLRIGDVTNGTTRSVIKIFGGGGKVDARGAAQTGVPPGYDGIRIQTGDGTLSGDIGSITNVSIADLTVSDGRQDSISLHAILGGYFLNCIFEKARRNNLVVTAAQNVIFDSCAFNGATAAAGTPTTAGSGVWNEPNQTWDAIDNVTFIGCEARDNIGSGFKIWNSGAAAKAVMDVVACRSIRNQWDGAAYVTASSEGGFVVYANGQASQDLRIMIKDCLSMKDGNSGFIISRNSGGTSGQIEVINPVVIDANRKGNGGYLAAYLSVGGPGTTTVDVVSPRVIAMQADAGAYGIAVFRTAGDVITNVHIRNPLALGTFSSGLIVGASIAGSRLGSGALTATLEDAEWNSGATGGHPKFFPPIKPALLNQSSDPLTADAVINELLLWRDANGQFAAGYLANDNVKRYLDARSKRRIRSTLSYAGGTINAGTTTALTVSAVTGAAIGDHVSVACDVDLINLTVSAYVSAADTVKILISNVTAGNIALGACNFIVNVESGGY